MAKTIVIMAGGFHPFHAGHAALYNSARRAFPDAEVFVAATNDTSTRPFPFAIKEKLAKLAGVESGHFVQVKSPFQAREITAGFNPDVDKLIFVRSEKDADKPPQAGGVKKDGSPSYLQPLLGAKKLEPFGKRAYMAYLPTVEFGPGMTSATEIRTAWPQLNEKRKTALVMSLYPATQTNPALAANVVKLLDAAMGGELAEGVKLKFHTIELDRSQIKEYAKQYFECHNIELPHGKFINNVSRFGSKKLTESSESNEIAPFIQMINSVDSPKIIKVGDYFSVLAFGISFAWKEIEARGFTTPKEVVDIKMHSNGTISYIEFADGDRYPRLTPATYQGKPIVQTAYFDRAGAASSSLTALALKVPDGWDFNTADVEQGLNEFAPSDNGGGRKFIPWPEFIDAVKQIVGKDFSVKENVVKSTIKARFVPHDPMEYGPTMLYSYYEARAGRNKGAVSTRGSIQVGKYFDKGSYFNSSDPDIQNQLLTSFNLLKGHPFERHFDLTFDNIYKIANIILGNTEGAYQMPQQQGVAETLAGVSAQGFVGGMHAAYQDRENQPTNEDYLDE